MNIKRNSAAVMAAAVLAVGAPVMGLADPLSVVASAAESNPSLTYSINGVEFKPSWGLDSYPAECIPTDPKSYTVKVDIRGNVPKEGYDLTLDALLFYNEDYTCDMTWTCGGKFQVATDGIVLYRYKGYDCLNDLLGMGGGIGGDIAHPTDCTEIFSSVSGDIALEKGNYAPSSEEYKRYVEDYNWYIEENNIVINEYPYSWYKLGSGKKSATIDIGKAPAPEGDVLGIVDQAQRGEHAPDEAINRVEMAISSGLDFNFTVTEPGTIELHFKAKDGSGAVSGDKFEGVSDTNAGVSITGVSGAAKVNVSSKKNDNGSYTYDITPVDAGGNKVQPNEAAVVGIMLPSDLGGKALNVYRVENGKYIKLNSWTDGDMFFFTTTHFSEFEITTEQREEANPGTGSAGIAGFAAVALVSVGMLIVSRKKR